jgi:outer membrane protein assembly factor BamA
MKLKLLMLAIVFWIREGQLAFAQTDTILQKPTTELMPIVSYDTDTGFGYGVKLFALNHLGLDESFDLVLFNSTKGERWYRFVFSFPDFEKRQAAKYPLAVDVVVDYDKWIRSSFFGVGNASGFDAREYYTKEPVDVSIALSRGFTHSLVGQAGVRYKIINSFNVEHGRVLDQLFPAVNPSKVRYASLFLVFRYDTRKSFINPSEGLVLQGESEFASGTSAFTRLGVSAQHYTCFLQSNIVVAARFSMQRLIGKNLPLQVLLPVGGNNTVRGSPQDRFLDRVSAVANAEIRFPIYWRFGGVAGFDAGKVWYKFSDVDLNRWATNPLLGLRFYMDTFVVRLDMGFGKETMGFYLNFGHMF